MESWRCIRQLGLAHFQCSLQMDDDSANAEEQTDLARQIEWNVNFGFLEKRVSAQTGKLGELRSDADFLPRLPLLAFLSSLRKFVSLRLLVTGGMDAAAESAVGEGEDVREASLGSPASFRTTGKGTWNVWSSAKVFVAGADFGCIPNVLTASTSSFACIVLKGPLLLLLLVASIMTKSSWLAFKYESMKLNPEPE